MPPNTHERGQRGGKRSHQDGSERKLAMADLVNNIQEARTCLQAVIEGKEECNMAKLRSAIINVDSVLSQIAFKLKENLEKIAVLRSRSNSKESKRFGDSNYGGSPLKRSDINVSTYSPVSFLYNKKIRLLQ